MMSKVNDHLYKTLELQPKLKNMLTSHTVKLARENVMGQLSLFKKNSFGAL